MRKIWVEIIKRKHTIKKKVIKYIIIVHRMHQPFQAVLHSYLLSPIYQKLNLSSGKNKFQYKNNKRKLILKKITIEISLTLKVKIFENILYLKINEVKIYFMCFKIIF